MSYRVLNDREQKALARYIASIEKAIHSIDKLMAASDEQPARPKARKPRKAKAADAPARPVGRPPKAEKPVDPLAG